MHKKLEIFKKRNIPIWRELWLIGKKPEDTFLYFVYVVLLIPAWHNITACKNGSVPFFCGTFCLRMIILVHTCGPRFQRFSFNSNKEASLLPPPRSSTVWCVSWIRWFIWFQQRRHWERGSQEAKQTLKGWGHVEMAYITTGGTSDLPC